VRWTNAVSDCSSFVAVLDLAAHDGVRLQHMDARAQQDRASGPMGYARYLDAVIADIDAHGGGLALNRV